MRMKLGANIAALRRKRGMTQEQLADAVGVSAPAVSKWETDSSCPDIALLCPLAMALGVDLNALMGFEANLSEREASAIVERALEAARSEGADAAEVQLRDALRRYPSSAALKFFANSALALLDAVPPLPDEATRQRRSRWRRQLCEAVRADAESAFRPFAVEALANMALDGGELDRAERLLEELPDRECDSTAVRARLHLARGEREEARRALQTRLYLLLTRMRNCLLELCGQEMEPDPRRGLAVADALRNLDELFGLGWTTGGVEAMLLLRAGRKACALARMERFVDALLTPAHALDGVLFSQLQVVDGADKPSTWALRQALLRALLEDEEWRGLREEDTCRRIVDKLRASLGES